MNHTAKKLLLVLLSFTGFLISEAASAQMINNDSMNLVARIAADKEKLEKMQAAIPEKEKLKAATAEKAQQSADDNRKAANRLSNDPQDRKLARRADREAGDARSDAKKAREAADDLDDLHKDIRKLTERIEKEQKKLDKYIQTARSTPQS